MKFYAQDAGTLFNELEDDHLSMNGENRWIRLAKAMPWASVERIYNKTLNNRCKGAPNKPARMVVGAMMIKHMMNLSDEETVMLIQENPYMQYFAGLDAFSTEPIFTAELLTVARHRMGEDTFNEITLVLAKAEEGSRKGGDGEDGGEETDEDGQRHNGVCKVDTTCMDAEMKYPTDVNLLEDGSREMDRLSLKLCATAAIKKPRTNRGEARSAYVRYLKKKSKGKRLTTDTKQRQIHLLAQDIDTFFCILGRVPSTAFRVLNRRDPNQLNAVRTMLGQHTQMLAEGISRCSDRIVSIYQSHVRPSSGGRRRPRWNSVPSSACARPEDSPTSTTCPRTHTTRTRISKHTLRSTRNTSDTIPPKCRQTRYT